ncbi:hypothetical protein K3495_g9076 [Podosphaera aphanis]|nr:hypothetical protein K3495_g9076 [Podosphaera aphanis]
MGKNEFTMTRRPRVEGKPKGKPGGKSRNRKTSAIPPVHIFEGYLSNSGELSPIGVSQIHTLSEAIAPYLRRAASNQTDLEKLNYEKYVEELSSLATNWESLPEFQAKSVDDTVETYTENAIGDLPLNIQEQLRKQIVDLTPTQTQPNLLQSQSPKPNENSLVRDHEGDIKISGTDIYSIVFTVISAINNGNNPEGLGQARPLDKRQNAPHCSEEERNQLLKSSRCIRCNVFPSHRFRECKLKGYRSEMSNSSIASASISETERGFGYIVANSQYNIFLSKGWAERSNITYETGKKFLTLGSGANAIKVKESGWMERDELSGPMRQLRQAKRVTASIFAAESRRGRKAKKYLYLFSITIVDINKALEKLDNSAIKQTGEEISTDEDGIIPESKPVWDRSINLELDDEGKPKEPSSGPLYGMSRDELLVLRKTHTDYIQKRWIRASNSPANGPVLFAKKPGGGLRSCVDYRGLKSITNRDRYPLPFIKETLQQLLKAQYFTKLDVCTAFHRLHIRPDDEWKTAFRKRYGQYECLIMPFGLCSGPDIF